MVGGLRHIYLSGDRMESDGAKSSPPPMNTGTTPQIRLPANADANVPWLIISTHAKPIAANRAAMAHVQRLIRTFVMCNASFPHLVRTTTRNPRCGRNGFHRCPFREAWKTILKSCRRQFRLLSRVKLPARDQPPGVC